LVFVLILRYFSAKKGSEKHQISTISNDKILLLQKSIETISQLNLPLQKKNFCITEKERDMIYEFEVIPIKLE